MLSRKRKNEEAQSGAHWGCIGTVFAALIGAVALLLSVIIKVPTDEGTLQPIIIVIVQTIFENRDSSPPSAVGNQPTATDSLIIDPSGSIDWTPAPSSTMYPTSPPTPEPVPTANAPSATPPVIPIEHIAPHNSAVHPLGLPWEQNDVSLNLIRLDLRAESDSQLAASQAWFRFFNLSGQRLLVEIDWNNIYMEDSQGSRYVDWEGGGTTSVWVDAGSSYDFNRYYTKRPDNRSRVPSSATHVLVTVEEFSRIGNAIWKWDINPVLTPIVPPSSQAVKPIGGNWEQNGFSLALVNADIRAESASQAAAAQLWFVLTNNTNERRLVEIDFSHIHMIDSFGRRFIDYEGGGIWAQWLDSGESLEFYRYYSEMAEESARITRGSDFVLVIAERLARIDFAQWRIDIVR